jgi:hypothetical protein
LATKLRVNRASIWFPQTGRRYWATPPSAFLEELHAGLPIGKVWRRTITVVGRAPDRLLRESEDRGRLLRDELERERVAHARTEERLQNVKGQNGAQLLLQALGGAALGWAGGKLLEGQPSWLAGVVAMAGLVFLAFGSWPFPSPDYA